MEENSDRLAWLLESAGRISNRQNLPIPIIKLLDRFRLALEIVQVGSSKEVGGSLVERGGNHVLRLARPDPDAPLSRHELFTVAHELGHLALIRKYGWQPKTRAEHYECERLCDRFAGQLLIPERHVRKFRPDSAKMAVHYAQAIAVSCGVSLEVAARRLMETWGGLGFFWATPTHNSKGLPVWMLVWANCSIRGFRLARHQHLSEEAELGRYLNGVVGPWSMTDTASDQEIGGGITAFARPKGSGQMFGAVHKA